MFASTHSNPDENTAKYVQAQQSATASAAADQTPSEVQLLATAEADAAVHAEVSSGPSVELAQKMPNGTAGPAASNPGQPVGGNLSGNMSPFCSCQVALQAIALHAIASKFIRMLMSALCIHSMSHLRLANSITSRFVLHPDVLMC